MAICSFDTCLGNASLHRYKIMDNGFKEGLILNECTDLTNWPTRDVNWHFMFTDNNKRINMVH